MAKISKQNIGKYLKSIYAIGIYNIYILPISLNEEQWLKPKTILDKTSLN